jgi:Putative small multi-drug export protein
MAIAMVQMPLTAHAAKKAKEATEHLHTGQKVANFFRTFGIPDLAVLAIISALPVVELRGSIPVGIWMGYPITTVLPVCVLGNMAPIVPLLYLLRNKTLK